MGLGYSLIFLFHVPLCHAPPFPSGAEWQWWDWQAADENSHWDPVRNAARHCPGKQLHTCTQFDIKIWVSYFYFLLLDSFVRRRVVLRGGPGQLWGSTAGIDPSLLLSLQVDLPLSDLLTGSSPWLGAVCSALCSHQQDPAAAGDMSVLKPF